MMQNIVVLRNEIAGKNRKITQMEAMNKKLQKQNKYLTNLCLKEKRPGIKLELDNEGEDGREGEEIEGEIETADT